MRTLITLIILAIMFFLIAKTKISFSPFEISMQDWKLATGLYIFFVGLLFLKYHFHQKGYREGVEMEIETVKEVFNEKTETCDHKFTTAVVSGSCEVEELVDRCINCGKEENKRTE